MSDLKKLVQEIITLVPEKEAELKKLLENELREPPLNVWRGNNGDWLLGDNPTSSSSANICVFSDSNNDIYIHLHNNYYWEIREGNKLYAICSKHEPCQPQP